METNGSIYIGGGFTGKRFTYYSFCKDILGRTSLPLIFRLCPDSYKWIALPSSPSVVIHFGLASVAHKIYQVGGEYLEESDHHKIGVPSNMVMVYDTEEGKWVDDLPSLHFPRSLPSVAATQTHLIVAGGVDAKQKPIASIEIFDLVSKNNSWLVREGVPLELCYPQIIIIDGILYWGADRASGLHFKTLQHATDELNQNQFDVYSIPVDNLLHGRVKILSKAWSKLPSLPSCGSALVDLEGSVLLVGGRDKKGKSSNFCYSYDKEEDTWEVAKVHKPDRIPLTSNCISPAAIHSQNKLYLFGGIVWSEWMLIKIVLTLISLVLIALCVMAFGIYVNQSIIIKGGVYLLLGAFLCISMYCLEKCLRLPQLINAVIIRSSHVVFLNK